MDNPLWNLPNEVWHSQIIPWSTFLDLCRLDSSVLSFQRTAFLNALSEAELVHEEIITPDMMIWFTKRAIKPMKIKLTEDISTEDVLELSEYCPKLMSLNTCDFDVDAQTVLKRGRSMDEIGVEYSMRTFDESFVSSLLSTFKNLQYLTVDNGNPIQWFAMFPHVAHLCVHSKKLKYRENDIDGGESGFHCYFNLTHESLDFDTLFVPSIDFFQNIAAHFSSIRELLIGTSRSVGVDAGLLVLAKGCTALRIVHLCVCITDETLVEFCRLHPDLEELRLEEVDGPTYTPAGVRQALALLPELQDLACFVKGDGRFEWFRAVADAQVECGGRLEELSISKTTNLSNDCWEYVLQKCSSLKAVHSGSGIGTGQLRKIAHRYGVRVVYAAS